MHPDDSKDRTRARFAAFLRASAARAAAGWIGAYESSPLVRGLSTVSVTAWRIDRADAALAALAPVLAMVAPMPLVGWAFPSWIAAAGHAATAALLLATIAAFVIVLAAVARPSRGTIGNDGVLVERRLAKPRFIPFSSVERVRAARDTIDLALRGGGFVRLELAPESRETVLRTIERALATAHAPSRAHDHQALARGGRPVAAWIDHVRVAAPPTVDYRSPGLPVERLFHVVEDPRACATARAAAACALAPFVDDGGRARLRVAATETAHPDLRVALRVAAEAAHDEDAMASAMARVAAR